MSWDELESMSFLIKYQSCSRTSEYIDCRVPLAADDNDDFTI